jgi:hypothetical protein
VEVFVGRNDEVVPLGEGEAVSMVPVNSGGVPEFVVAGEANGV